MVSGRLEVHLVAPQVSVVLVPPQLQSTAQLGLAAPLQDEEDSKFGYEVVKRGNLWKSAEPPVDGIILNIADDDYRAACQGRTFWWTNGGNEFGPMVYSRHGLPDPYFFTTMITGNVK